MKTSSKRMREARQEVQAMSASFAKCLKIMEWMRTYKADTTQFSPWNYDSGVCYHLPTRRPVHQNWTEEEVKTFCQDIGAYPKYL